MNILVHGQKEERKLNILTIWVSDTWVSAGLSSEQPHAVLHMEKMVSRNGELIFAPVQQYGTDCEIC